jgi:hypothetical protein
MARPATLILTLAFTATFASSALTRDAGGFRRGGAVFRGGGITAFRGNGAVFRGNVGNALRGGGFRRTVAVRGAISGLGLGFFTSQSYPVAVPVPDQQQQSQDQPAEQQQQSDDPLAAAGNTREQQRATIRAAAVAYCIVIPMMSFAYLISRRLPHPLFVQTPIFTTPASRRGPGAVLSQPRRACRFCRSQ